MYRDDQGDGKHTKHTMEKTLMAEQVINKYIKN